MSLFLSAGKNLQDKPFYCYGGERIYLEVDYARISIVSEEKFKAGDAIKLTNVPDFSIRNGEKDHTRQNIVLFEENAKKTQGEEIFITEIEFSKNLKQADYQDIIQHLSKEEHLVRVMPAYIVSGQKLGISHNFYVKLFKEEDRTKLFELAKKHAVQVLGYNEFMPLWFTLSCGRESFLNSIEAANLFFETGLFLMEYEPTT